MSYAQSRVRVAKERAIRRRKLKRLWARLKPLSLMTLPREALLMKLGAARQKSPDPPGVCRSSSPKKRPPSTP